MREVYKSQLKELNNDIILMATHCEEAISIAIQGLIDNNYKQFEKSKELETRIDRYERNIENQCMRLLLMQQPVATDLRIVSSALKMISDLERIGDQAYDIADISRHINSNIPPVKNDIKEMAMTVISMVTESTNSYINKDAELAKETIKKDDIVDNYLLRIKEDVIQIINSESNNAELAIDLMMIAKYLERIGDHAVNVAEWVIYAVNGEHIDKL